MKDLFENLLGSLGDEGVDALGSMINKNNKKDSKDAISTVAGMIFQGMGKNAESKEGTDSLLGALDKKHDGSILDNLGDFIKAGDDTDGSKILGHIFGSNQKNVEKTVAKNNGIDLRNAKNLLIKMAPIVLGMLGKEKKDGNLSSNILSSILKSGGKSANDNSSLGINLMTAVLDADGDGSIVDDLMKKGGGLLGKMFA